MTTFDDEILREMGLDLARPIRVRTLAGSILEGRARLSTLGTNGEVWTLMLDLGADGVAAVPWRSIDALTQDPAGPPRDLPGF